MRRNAHKGGHPAQQAGVEGIVVTVDRRVEQSKQRVVGVHERSLMYPQVVGVAVHLPIVPTARRRHAQHPIGDAARERPGAVATPRVAVHDQAIGVGGWLGGGEGVNRGEDHSHANVLVVVRPVALRSEHPQPIVPKGVLGVRLGRLVLVGIRLLLRRDTHARQRDENRQPRRRRRSGGGGGVSGLVSGRCPVW